MADLIKRNYLPATHDKRLKWLSETYIQGFNQYKSRFDISNEQAQTVQDAVTKMLYDQRYDGDLDSFRKARTVYSNGLDTSKSGGAATPPPQFVPAVEPTLLQPIPPNGYFVFIAELNDNSIIGKTGYDAVVEAAMGLVPIKADDSSDTMPDIADLVAHDAGRVTVKYTMHGHRAIGIESKRSSEPGVVTSAQSSWDHWEDERPNKVEGQSESRSYRIRYELSPGVYSDFSPWESVATLV